MKSTFAGSVPRRGAGSSLRAPLPAPLRLASALALAAALGGCAGRAPLPAWQQDAKDAVDGFTSAWLAGDTAAADAEFARARRASGSTGRFDRVAQVELVRCAVRVAGLDYDCPGYDELAEQATPAQQAYAAYLAGRWSGLDARLLPEQHRAVPAGGALTAVQDPLARLVAAGALLKAGRIDPGGIAIAVETASNQGWRRPLLAWLGVQEQRALAAGDGESAARIRRRIALATAR